MRMKTNMKMHFLAAAGLALLAAAYPALAQDWSSRPVKIHVGFTLGGPVDATALVIADKLSLALKQPVIINNKPVANGVIPSALIEKSAPDGYKLMICASTIQAARSRTCRSTPTRTSRRSRSSAMVRCHGPLRHALGTRHTNQRRGEQNPCFVRRAGAVEEVRGPSVAAYTRAVHQLFSRRPDEVAEGHQGHKH